MQSEDSNGSNARSLNDLVNSQKEGYSLDQWFYTNPAAFDAEIATVFRTNWLCVGHVAQVPRTGDFFLFEVATDSVIVIRGDDGVVRAMANVCRHRGSQICAEESGSAKRLVCPYHNWSYKTDGCLAKASHLPETFDKDTLGLHLFQCKVSEGLIFVGFADEPVDFSPFENEIAPQLRVHRLDEAEICHEASYDIAANWKLVVENSRECYHCSTAHPQYTRAVAFAAGISSDRIRNEESMTFERQRERLSGLGMDIEPVPFLADTWHHCRRFFLQDNFSTQSVDGKPVGELMGDAPDWDVGVLGVVCLPNLLLEVNPDYAMLLTLYPIAPQITRARVTWLASPETTKKGCDTERLTEFWRLTAEQDWKLCEDNQRGVNSRFYQPGPYAEAEGGVKHFAGWYQREVRNGNGA